MKAVSPSFLEKPGWGEVFSDTVNTGIYVIEPDVLNYIPENRSFDFSKNLFPLLMEKGFTIYGISMEGYWRDVGNPDSYRDVHKDIFSGKVNVEIPGEVKELDGCRLILQGESFVSPKAKLLGTVVLGDGVVVEDNVYLENVTIGSGTKVRRGSQLRNCVLWRDAVIGSQVKLDNCVVCNDVQMGNRVQAPKGAIIAEKVEIGDDVLIEKDVVIWPGKFVESGSIVSSNLVWGEKWKRSLFQAGKISGRTNVELSVEFAAKLGAAFGTVLPEGSTIFMSRDYHRASRMIKRAFLSGVLSAGVNVVDLREFPRPALCYLLRNFAEVAGIHFEVSDKAPEHTDIIFFDKDGVVIDSSFEKEVERIFFRERFRRVSPSEIGRISGGEMLMEQYVGEILALLDESIRLPGYRVVVDLMNGVYRDVYPSLLANYGIESVILNSHRSEEKITHINLLCNQAEKNVPSVLRAVGADVGFAISPCGERLEVVAKDGTMLRGPKLLLLFLLAIDEVVEEPVKVLVPPSAPTVLNGRFKER